MSGIVSLWRVFFSSFSMWWAQGSALLGDLENAFLLFFFMDGDTLQSCFIFKAAWCLEWGSFLLHQQRKWCTNHVSLKRKEGNHRKMKAWGGGGLRRKGVCFSKNCAFLSSETAGNYFGLFWKIFHSDSSLKVTYLFFASIVEDACVGDGGGGCKFSSLLISLLATHFLFLTFKRILSPSSCKTV